MRSGPVIVHLDLDAFFSAVEQLHKPSLRGKPVVVGGIGRRGVVSTASYEARAFGVGSAMPIGEARRRCPNAAYLWPRFEAYKASSTAVMGLVKHLSPLVEQVSIDEAYVDLTPAHPDLDVLEVTALAEVLRAQVLEQTGLTVSVGAGTSKLIAKIASELDKPDGLRVIAPGEEASTLAPMPVRRLPGIGPATAERLHRHGVHVIGELAALPVAEVTSILGNAHGAALHGYANGADKRPVEPERDTKSISAETTFDTDLTDRRHLSDLARRLSDRVTGRLAAEGISGRTVTIKIRRHDFTTFTRSFTLDQPTDSASKIAATASQLLSVIDTTEGIRLLGVGVSGLSEYAQQDLLAELDAEPGGTLDDDEPLAGSGPDEADPPAQAGPAPDGGLPRQPVTWLPGQDVMHDQRGPGWVQGTGSGVVTVRFEGPHTGPGPIKSFPVTDPALTPADPPVW
jgi:DNA polymerase IV